MKPYARPHKWEDDAIELINKDLFTMLCRDGKFFEAIQLLKS